MDLVLRGFAYLGVETFRYVTFLGIWYVLFECSPVTPSENCDTFVLELNCIYSIPGMLHQSQSRSGAAFRKSTRTAGKMAERWKHFESTSDQHLHLGTPRLAIGGYIRHDAFIVLIMIVRS